MWRSERGEEEEISLHEILCYQRTLVWAFRVQMILCYFSLLFKDPSVMTAFEYSSRAHSRVMIRLKERIHRKLVLWCLARSICLQSLLPCLIHNILKGGDVSHFWVGKYRQGSGRTVACGRCRRSWLLLGFSSQASLTAVTVSEQTRAAHRWAAAPGLISLLPRPFCVCWPSGMG